MRPSFSPRTRRRLAVIAISTLVGLAAASLNARGHLEGGVATAHVMIDYPGPSIVDRRADAQDENTLEKHAELYGRLLTTDPVLADVARRIGIPVSELSGVARLTNVPFSLTQPGSEERAHQIVASWAKYRLELQSEPHDPLLHIYAAAPSGEAAQRLAQAAVAGLHDYLVGLAHRQGFSTALLPQLRTLGEPVGTTVNRRARLVIGMLTFLVAFALTATLAFAAIRFLGRRDPRPDEDAADFAPADDDWPHTNRLLPWSIAGFITILWLTPFDNIQLSFHTPIDLKLDRLLLPFVFALWLIAFAVGGRAKPRIRFTWVHAAIAGFVAVAFLSVVLDARYLNQTMELMLSLKKLPLLVSYVSLFWMISTSVRPAEVHAFMTLTCVLAVIVGLGIIYEYRFKTNVFTLVAQKLLVRPLVLLNAAPTPGGGLDSLGRSVALGPTDAGLEAVAVLALALPIMVVRMLSAQLTKQRLLYGAAVCIVVAGAFATSRKSALLAPAAVLVTLGYFRRRELLSLAPMGLVMAIGVSILSPGAVHGTIQQFVRPDSSNVATTSDRVSDYDAIRPDVWTHLLFGRGFGSYNHETYRVLDSEILTRTIETGVIGLLAFLLIGVAVILASRRLIGQRENPYSPIALIGAASAAAFLVVSTLFDVLGFPHATYIFLSMAGLVSVVLGRRIVEPTPVASTHDAPPLYEPVMVGPDENPQRQDALV